MASGDVQKIIDRILSSPRAQASNALAGRVYADEPILRRGSQMAGYLPEPLRHTRELARTPQARTKPEAWVFYQQARELEAYEDDVWYTGGFESYFPTYQAMNDRQLRGYFTWRTAVRQGQVKAAPTSFAFVYLYELLCGVGIRYASGLLGDVARQDGLDGIKRLVNDGPHSPAERGFRLIERFWQEYRVVEPKLDRYVKSWLRDYAIWHGLSPRLVSPYVDLSFDEALTGFSQGLSSWRSMDGSPDQAEEPLFETLDTLSSYRPRVSRLWRDRPETLRHVSCDVIVRLAAHYDKRRKKGLVESLFGSAEPMPCTLFASAVFWAERHPDTTYELSAATRYVCKNGRWYREGHHGSRERSGELGHILRAVDQRLREAIGYEHPLTEKVVAKYLGRLIDEAIERRLAWEREQEARTIHVDLSQLAGIRAAANVTREALLLDEEREEPVASELETVAQHHEPAERKHGEADGELQGTLALDAAVPTHGETEPPETAGEPQGHNEGGPAGEAAARSASPETPGDAALPLGLTVEEHKLLRALLDREAVPAGPLDMLVDGINEKLFDLLGDTALEYVSGTPAIIEDYEPDLREALGHD